MASKQAYLEPYAAYGHPQPGPASGARPQPSALYAAATQGGGGGLGGEHDDGDPVDEGLDEELDKLLPLEYGSGDADPADIHEGEPIEKKEFHSSNDVIRYQEQEAMRKKLKARQAKRKPKSARVWTPNGQYELVRRGRPLLGDPDSMGKDLCEENFFYFRHVPVEDGRHVEFASDPHRPLWKGVFQVPPNCGCGPDEYWNPTQANYKIIYGPHEKEDEDGIVIKVPPRDKPNQPADNMVIMRDGTRLPYWVDEWQRHKDNDQDHKLASRQKKDAQRKAILPPGPCIRPLQGAMLAYVNSQPLTHGVFSAWACLKPAPANQLASRIGPGAIRAMKRATQAPPVETSQLPVVQSASVEQPGPLPPPPPPTPAADAIDQMREQIEQQRRDMAEEKAEYARQANAIMAALDQQKAEHERQKAEYEQKHAAEAQRLLELFQAKQKEEEYMQRQRQEQEKAALLIVVPPPHVPRPPTSRPPDVPPAAPAPPVDGLLPVRQLLGNATALRKLKYAFLASNDGAAASEQIMTEFVSFIEGKLAPQTVPQVLKTLLRKALYSFLGEADLEKLDIDQALTQFSAVVTAKALELP